MSVGPAAQSFDSRAASRSDSGSYGPFTLQSLSLLSAKALTRRYARGVLPSLEAMEGFGRGRILSLTGLAGREPVASVLRELTGSPLFPWLGKRFEVLGSGQGEGINRLVLFGGKRELFRFRVTEERSLADDQPCLCLDYDLPENPRPLRRLRDELREVAPNLYMGPAFVRLGRLVKPVLYFGLSFRSTRAA